MGPPNVFATAAHRSNPTGGAYTFVRRKAVTSTRLGMEGCAPIRVTEIAAAAAAKRALSMVVLPMSRPVAKAPLKVSPAAVVSTAFTG